VCVVKGINLLNILLWIRFRQKYFYILVSRLFKYLLDGKRLVVLDDWLTVHRSITLFDLQLYAQNSYLFKYNRFIKILYMFRALPCSSLGGLRRKCIYAASGIVTLCRWLSCAPVLNWCTEQSPPDSDDTRGCIYRVSQEEGARLRESVPYVKVYRYNPKNLYPKLNGYRDNGQQSLKLWQLLHTYW
jgi:hypothetical protein